jgi:hypothetical protein
MRVTLMPERAVVIPARPAMLVVGDRQVPIDEWPLARSAEERRAVEFERTEDDQLVIAPRRRAGAGLVAKTLFVIAAGALPGVIAMAMQVPPWLAVPVSGAMMVVVILFLRASLARLRQYRFDRRQGRLIIERRAGFRPEWRVEREEPLASILAVQLLFNGHHTVAEPQGAGEQQTTSYRDFDGYELNLVLDGPPPGRLHLLALADWEWIRRAGREVGDFLGVPVIDGLYHGD